MGIEEIADRIEKEAELKVKGILEDTDSKSVAIINNAKKKADALLSQRLSSAKESAEMIVSKASSKAEVEGSQIYQKALSESINKSIEDIRKQLPAYAKSGDYKKLLNKLCASALEEFGDGCIITANKQDIDVIKQIPGISVEQAGGAFSGGIIAYSSDRKRSIDYTLDRLLSSIEDKIAVEVLKRVK